jgi:squalene-hopene/tetraprenyl-beta-curcumene cyclase
MGILAAHIQHMKLIRCMTFILLATPHYAVAADAPKPKPQFQYETKGIEVSLPSAEEAKVAAFNASTIKAAAKYLDNGAICWVREKTCVNCHTTGPYMSERTALTAWLGRPNDEVLENFVDSIPDQPTQEKEENGLKYYPGSEVSVWRSLGLAEWDKHVTGQLSDPTDRSLRDMLLRQSDNGAFVSYGEVEIPHITTDFELTLQAARAITAAPGWLAHLKDTDLLARVEKMKAFLRDAKPRNDFDRVLRLQLASYLPELVTQRDREAALALLSQKQHPDGGWSLRDMSAMNDWHFTISDTVAKIITSLPDAANPESDPYMTGLAIVLLRQSDVPATDDRIQRGLTWLKREERVSGRWWMRSLYRGNYSYITYIATAQAMTALAMCGEIR